MNDSKVNPWVELLVEVEEMRKHQKAFFKMKANHPDKKKIMAFSKLTEMKVDQLVSSLKKTCEEKGISLNIKENETSIDD